MPGDEPPRTAGSGAKIVVLAPHQRNLGRCQTPEQQRVTRYALQPPGYILRLPRDLTRGDTAGDPEEQLRRQSGVCRQLHQLVDRLERRLGQRRRALTDRELGELLRRWSAKLTKA